MRSAVLKATLDELVAGGCAAFGFDGVARRAGVHKTTLGQAARSCCSTRCPSSAVNACRSPTPGSLAADLRALGNAIVASARTPEVEAVARAVAAIGDRNPLLAAASRRFWSTRLELAGEIVRRAIARGEIPHDTDSELVLRP